MIRYILDPRLYIIFTILLFIVPLPWLVSWMFAVLIHEMSHYVVVKCLDGKICAFSAGLGGANMVCTGLKGKCYIVAVMAGPIGGFAVGLLGRWFPRLAICSWLLSVYNLIPVLPLDGGRVAQIFFKSERQFRVFERFILIAVSLLAVIGCLYLRISPFALVFVISLWVKNRKSPCKESLCAVQ